MTPGFVGIGGMVLAMALACGSAQAFSDAPASSGWRQNAPDEQAPPDYRYSGNGLSFSMSRNTAPPDGASPSEDASAQQPQPSPSRPGFFQRVIGAFSGGKD